MPSNRITAAVLDLMKPGDVTWDTEVRGFGVRGECQDSCRTEFVTTPVYPSPCFFTAC